MPIKPMTLTEFEDRSYWWRLDLTEFNRITAALRDREALLAANYRRPNAKTSTGKRITK